MNYFIRGTKCSLINLINTRMDESIVALSRRLGMTRDGLVNIIKYMNSLKQQVNNLEGNNQEQLEEQFKKDINVLY